jgi:hypothetical protein
MLSATNLISFPRSVESHRSRELPLKFAREVLSMEPDFVPREHTTGPILIASDGSMTAWMSAGLPC